MKVQLCLLLPLYRARTIYSQTDINIYTFHFYCHGCIIELLANNEKSNNFMRSKTMQLEACVLVNCIPKLAINTEDRLVLSYFKSEHYSGGVST